MRLSEFEWSRMGAAHRQQAKGLTDHYTRDPGRNLPCRDEEAEHRAIVLDHHHDDVSDIPAGDPVEGAIDEPAVIGPLGARIRRACAPQMGVRNTRKKLA